jgi:phosphate transport system permease protein
VAVFLVVGRQDNNWPEFILSLRPLAEAGQTLTSKMGGSETFLAYGDPLHWAAIMGLGLVLVALVLVLSVAGGRLTAAGRRHA